MEPSDVFSLLPSESLPESSRHTEKNRKRKRRNQSPLSRRTFKLFISRTKKVVIPGLQLGNLPLQELEDFLLHIVDIFQDDLCLLQRKQNRKALSVRDLQTVLKLNFPNILLTTALEFAKKATGEFFKTEVEITNLEEEPVIPSEELLSESSKEKVKEPIKKNQKTSNSSKFKPFFLQKKKVLMPELKLGNLALQELDDFLNHMTEFFLENIQTLQRRKKKKTLDINDMEAILNLCLPAKHATAASEFGKEAVKTYFRNMSRRS